MTLTFKPALQTTTALPVAPNGRATLQFSASFSTRDEYVRTRRDGAHIEMWTNLPVGGHDGSDWHALAFGYPDEETMISPDAASNKVFTLSPTTTENVYLGDNSTVVLDLALTDARPGAVYSFTYRLVHANGAIQWLGAYGQNGDLVLEEQETRFTLAPGSTLEDGTIVNSDLNAEDASVTLATLNKSIDWVCWGFNEDGTCKASYSGLELPPSSAVLLVPRPNDARLVDVQPLLLKAYGGAVSVTANGDLVRHDGLAVLDVSEAFAEATVLPGSSIISIQSGFAVVASAGEDDRDAPTSLSLIAISRDAWTATSADIRIREADVRAILGSEHNDAVIVNPPVSVFGTWKAGEDLVVRVSAPGAQCIFAPVFSLPTTKDEESVSIALVTPSASARVEVVEELQGSALLTPPPSPPAVLRPIATVADTVPQPDAAPELSEDPEDIKTSVPPTPISATHETVEEPEEMQETPTIPTSLIPLANKSVGGNFFRFVLAFVAWLARPALEKFYGFFGGNILLWIAYKFFGSGPSEPSVAASNAEIEVMEVPDADELVEEEIVLQAEPTVEPDDSVSAVPKREKTLLRSFSELTVSDGSTIICEAEEEVELQEEAKVKTIHAKVVEDVSPTPPAPSRLEIPPRQSLVSTKSHLVVDSRSETVSLLATIKSKDTALPELDVIIDGERSRQPVKSWQLSQAVYHVELQLPPDSTKLRVALRQ